MRIAFLGKKPSEFSMSPVVQAFILSEGLFWSGINLVSPILAVFVVNEITGGNVEAAAISVSFYMIARVLSELLFGSKLNNVSDRKRYIYSIVGIIVVAFVYLLFVWADFVWQVYLLQILIGIGFGILSPAKFALFSTHLDENRAPSEWSIYDGVVYTGMASAAALGGFIVERYGFDLLFVVTSVFILLGALPYIMLLQERH